ncbi:MAG TPA: response regulator [Stellaceae bacterium]|nr:response regulator [Stellaceae bacterium]
MEYKETILVVDDESMLRAVFSDMLASGGYRCVVAANALDALRLIEANLVAFDMLVTDIVMPGELNGLDLAIALHERQSDVAILLITGYAESPIKKEAEARGYRILDKPFRQATLEAVIAEELAKRRAEKAEGSGSVVSLDRARQKREGH